MRNLHGEKDSVLTRGGLSRDRQTVVTTKREESAEAIVARAVPSEGPNLTTFNVRKLRRDLKNYRKQRKPGAGGSETERKRALHARSRGQIDTQTENVN